MNKTDYVYFYYSDEQIKEKNQMLKMSGKKFVAGIVVVNGKRQRFSQITTNKEAMKRYIDAYVICEGILGDMTYTLPSEA